MPTRYNEPADPKEYEIYASDPDSLFYAQQLPENSEGYAQNQYSIPTCSEDCWKIASNEYWTYVMCQRHTFPDQGWKIHITARLEDAQMLLFDVASFLFEHQVSFKFVPSPKAWINKNSKYANRAFSGKFITVYPSDEADFCSLLEKLERVTEPYEAGPYILNDKQWRGSNVFYRYGGMKRMVAEINGELVDAIQKPDGTYIPDQRIPGFVLPDFVAEPDFVRDHNVTPKLEESNPFNAFHVIEALHFSDAGGVYRAERNGRTLVLKEGREQAGFDGHGIDGYHRNRDEYQILKHLTNVGGVVPVGEYFTAWRHNYFTEQFIGGPTLKSFIAENYPFNNNLNKSEDAEKYAERCFAIINQTKRILKDIHACDIAVCDLSLTNIMLDEACEKPTFIDLEAAGPASRPFTPSLITRGFFSSQARSFLEQDWFAWYRIAYALFLPMAPLLDMAPDLRERQQSLIKLKFGQMAINALNDCRNFARGFTHLDTISNIMPRALDTPRSVISSHTIEETKEGLTTGLVDFLQVNSDTLISGDVNQHLTPLGKYNVAHGAFGVIMSLIRSGYGSKLKEVSGLEGWINSRVPYLEVLAKRKDSDFGLFTGLSGIAGVLDEIGAHNAAGHLLSEINDEIITSHSSDVSLYSGIAGVGMQLLAFGMMKENRAWIDTARTAADEISKQFSSIFRDTQKHKDPGLLTGWSGAALFLWKFAIAAKDENMKKTAQDILNFAVHNIEEEKQPNGGLYPVDHSRGMPRMLPYLENGSSGVALCFLEFSKDDTAVLTVQQRRKLEQLVQSSDLSHSYNAGLLSGCSGFLPLAAAVSTMRQDSSFLERIIAAMNCFIVRDGDRLLVPGWVGYKCSMDYASGSAGALLALHDANHTGRWDAWMPVPTKDLALFRADLGACNLSN